MRTMLVAMLSLWTVAVMAATPQPFIPLPIPSLNWHSDYGAATASGIANKVQAYLFVDKSLQDPATNKNPGNESFWSMIWNCNQNRTGDHRLFYCAVSCSGTFGAKAQDKVDAFTKAEDPSGGLVRALAGDVSGAFVLVNAEGRVVSIIPHSGDFAPRRAAAEALVSDAQQPICLGSASAPPSCAKALEYLKNGNTSAALALATKKLGADGQELAKSIAERIEAVFAADLDRVESPLTSTGDRFLALQRLQALAKEFPRSPSVAQVAAVIKDRTKNDEAYASELKAWAALEQYLVQAGKQSPSKRKGFQKAFLDGLIEHFPGTEAARLADLIKISARVDAE